jgi:hypothetical protein
VGTRVGVEGCGKFVPTGIRSPNRNPVATIPTTLSRPLLLLLLLLLLVVVVVVVVVEVVVVAAVVASVEEL